MVELKLNSSEARLLKGALERRLDTLLNEIAHTEDRDSRTALRQTYDRLDELQRRLLKLIDAQAA